MEQKLVETKNQHLHASGGLRIPFEVADGITVAVLQDQYRYLKEELRDHDEHGKWMHPEDVVNSRSKYLPALEVLIPYFGGSIK
jgi:ribosomal protein S12 methylthiotransferase accessory factor YcaO